nr:DUF933 domain-containing protein [Enterobacter ludwigii]
MRKAGLTVEYVASILTANREQGAKEADEVRAEGKDYIVKDGIVLTYCLNCKFNKLTILCPLAHRELKVFLGRS